MGKTTNKYFDLAFEYHVAALTLHSQIIEAPYLYNPISYLLRHTIELLLKGLIVIELKNQKIKVAINEIKIGKNKMNSIHSVHKLWNHYKDMSDNLTEGQINLIDNALKKLDKKDFSSTRYRYPYSKSGMPIPTEPVIFDMSGKAPDLALGIPYIIQTTEQSAILEKGRVLLQDIPILFDVIEFLFEIGEDEWCGYLDKINRTKCSTSEGTPPPTDIALPPRDAMSYTIGIGR